MLKGRLALTSLNLLALTRRLYACPGSLNTSTALFFPRPYSNLNLNMADIDASHMPPVEDLPPPEDCPTIPEPPKPAPAGSKASKKPEPESKSLPKLTAAEFRTYNRMAEQMDAFHNHFRAEWRTLHTAAQMNKRPGGLSIRAFLNKGLSFCQHLTFHHSIEEAHIFPVLASRMPSFAAELNLLTQHKRIHEGLEELEEYLEKCRKGERELRLREELLPILDGFGGVLWEHLDEEVKELGAENMRKYWSMEEMRRLPM